MLTCGRAWSCRLRAPVEPIGKLLPVVPLTEVERLERAVLDIRSPAGRAARPRRNAARPLPLAAEAGVLGALLVLAVLARRAPHPLLPRSFGREVGGGPVAVRAPPGQLKLLSPPPPSGGPLLLRVTRPLG